MLVFLHIIMIFPHDLLHHPSHCSWETSVKQCLKKYCKSSFRLLGIVLCLVEEGAGYAILRSQPPPLPLSSPCWTLSGILESPLACVYISHVLAHHLCPIFLPAQVTSSFSTNMIITHSSSPSQAQLLHGSFSNHCSVF